MDADARRARREALLAADAAKDAKEARLAAKTGLDAAGRAASRVARAAEAAAEAAGVSRALGRSFLDACKAGDAASALAHVESTPRLLDYRGEGTSYGFTGYGGLHWAASRGHTDLLGRLLAAGAHPELRNGAGATALHVAAAAGQSAACRLLILAGNAEPAAADDGGDVAAAVAAAKGHAATVAAIAAAGAAAAVRRRLNGASAAGSPNAELRALCLAAGVPTSDCLYKADLEAKAAEALALLPPVAPPPRQLPPDPPPAAAKPHSPPRHTAIPDTHDTHDETGDPETDETTTAKAAKAAADAAYARGDFSAAAAGYALALRLTPRDAKTTDSGNTDSRITDSSPCRPRAALRSNASACYAQRREWPSALREAASAVAEDSSWHKAHSRVGAAHMGLGQPEAAVAAYRLALACEGGEGAAGALAEAEAAAAAAARGGEDESSRWEDEATPIAPRAPRPAWFECRGCDNRTRMRGVTACCGEEVCGTCAARAAGGGGCPLRCGAAPA